MPQTRQNGTKVPTNTDSFTNLNTDLATFADSCNVIIPVASQSARDALTGKYAGMAVCRLDYADLPLQIWDGAKWVGPGRGQLATQSNSGSVVTGTTLNIALDTTITLDPNRLIRVTAQIEGTSDTSGLHIAYSLKYGGTTGTTGGTVMRSTTKRYNAANLGEGDPQFEGRYSSGAGGATRFSLQAQVTVTTGTVTHAAGQCVLFIDDMGVG